MNHKPVHSQLDRHQVLMDLAKTVKDHSDKNPEQDEYGYPEEQTLQIVPLHQSPK